MLAGFFLLVASLLVLFSLCAAWKRDTAAEALFYVWPMYRLNYLYSKLLAIKYFDLYTRDQGRFVKSYQGLLRNGYDATPDVLLEKFIGTNTRDPKLVNDALEVITHKTDELEQLYASAGQFRIKPGREQGDHASRPR